MIEIARQLPVQLMKYTWEVSQTLDYIHRFIYIHLIKGRVTGGATFHQRVLLDYLH